MNRQEIILEQLQKAKHKGVDINDIFHSGENNKIIDPTLCRLREYIGNKDSVIVKNGRWYLKEEYFNVSLSAFRKMAENSMFLLAISMNKRNTIKIVLIMAILCIIMSGIFYFVGYESGMPTLDEAIIIYPELRCH